MFASATDPTSAPGVAAPAAWRRALLLLLIMPALVGLLPPVAVCLQSWAHQRSFVLQLDGEEGYLLNQALCLWNGAPIYQPIDRPPFLVANYPPLFPWIWGVVHGWSLGQYAMADSLALGRRLVQVSALLAALLAATVVWLRVRSPVAAILAALVFLAGWEVNHWGHFARVDLPSLAFTLGGLALVMAGRRPWQLAAGALLMLAAGCTRQTALAAPLAAALALAFGDRRRLGWFLGPYLGVGLLLLGIAQWMTGGEFWRHTVQYNVNRMDWAGWRMLMRNEVWFFHRWLLLALAAAAIGLWWVRRRAPGRDDACGPPHADAAAVLYLLLSSFSLLSYAKIGAAPNYVLEPLASWAICLGLALGHCERRWLRGQAAAGVVMLAVAALTNAHAFRTGFDPKVAAIERMRLQLPLDPPSAAFNLVGVAIQTSGDVFCEQPAITLLARKPVLFQPFIMSQLAREGVWDPQPFLGMLQTHRFGCLIVNADLTGGAPGVVYERYTAPIAEAIRRRYMLRWKTFLAGGDGGTYFVLFPSGTAETP